MASRGTRPRVVRPRRILVWRLILAFVAASLLPSLYSMSQWNGPRFSVVLSPREAPLTEILEYLREGSGFTVYWPYWPRFRASSETLGFLASLSAVTLVLLLAPLGLCPVCQGRRESVRRSGVPPCPRCGGRAAVSIPRDVMSSPQIARAKRRLLIGAPLVLGLLLVFTYPLIPCPACSSARNVGAKEECDSAHHEGISLVKALTGSP